MKIIDTASTEKTLTTQSEPRQITPERVLDEIDGRATTHTHRKNDKKKEENLIVTQLCGHGNHADQSPTSQPNKLVF